MSGEHDTSVVSVGIVADPGTPSAVARNVSDQLPDALGRRIIRDVEWNVVTSTEELSLDAQGRLPVEEKARTLLPDRGWDVLICLTDLPRRNGTRPVIADVHAEAAGALVSLPAIGWMRCGSNRTPLRRSCTR
ncbi:hypothetical protein [Parasphingorhabdus pacifica]